MNINYTIMKKKILLLIAIVLICVTGMKAQKIYELNDLKQIPDIDEDNMKIIALSIVDLYKNAIKTPEKYSSDEAVKDTVYLFYDKNWNGKLNKINPSNGEKYSSIKNEELEKNNRLLFNLNFDESGNLIVPEKIFVISYQN